MCDMVISGSRHFSPVMFDISVGCPHFCRAVLARYHLSWRCLGWLASNALVVDLLGLSSCILSLFDFQLASLYSAWLNLLTCLNAIWYTPNLVLLVEVDPILTWFGFKFSAWLGLKMWTCAWSPDISAVYLVYFFNISFGENVVPSMICKVAIVVSEYWNHW